VSNVNHRATNGSNRTWKSMEVVALLLACAGCGSAPGSSITQQEPIIPNAPPTAAAPTTAGSAAPLTQAPLAGSGAPITSAPSNTGEFPTGAGGTAAPATAPTMPVAMQGGAAAPATTPTMATDWPADCEEHYKLLVFPSGQGLNSTDKVSVAAGQETHPQFTFTAPWGTDEVQAVKFAPITDNPKVLHHWILNGPPIGSTSANAATKFISGWAPGQKGEDLPADVGMYLPDGSLRLDVHYNNLTGTAVEMDKSGVEVCIIKNKANFRKNTAAVIGLVGNATVPAKATNYSQPATCSAVVTGGPVYFLGDSPHMHKLGVHGYMGLKRAGVETALVDEDFSFGDQRIYALDHVEVKSGDTLTTTCTYTNPGNQAVTFGENTGNEMCFNFATYYPMGDLTCGSAL
jgi:hypothetical protein